MKKWKEIIHHQTFRILDHTTKETVIGKSNNAITSFAIDDALAISISDHGSPPAMRLWVHPKTIVLGIPDSRLPHLDKGVNLLVNKGYDVVVRNSGGLAVALDEGVLNISLILPGVKHISIHDCYEAMVQFVRHMLKDLTAEIKAYEIIGSYCPGDYDLSIDGKKFAGISQRRVKDGAAIQIYLDVEGNSWERAALINHFYNASLQGEETKFSYPTVNPEVMASLTSLLGVKISVEEMKKRAVLALEDLSDKGLIELPFSENETALFEARFKQMIKRNEQIATLQGN